MPGSARRQKRPATKVLLAALMTLLCVEASERAPFKPAALGRPDVQRYGGQTATPDVTTSSAANADGTRLDRDLGHDPALRKTLRALQKRASGGAQPAAASTGSIVVGGSVADIPLQALAAYRRGAIMADAANPQCHIPWTLLAGIGRVESDHGQNGGSRPDAAGVVHPAILGPVLDGSAGNAAIADTDGGRFDGDTRWDRAVGPMQFIPSTWEQWGRDADGDGVADPENLFDAALAAADYLCAAGGDLRTPKAAANAVLSYNHSEDYMLLVLGYSSAYAGESVSALTAFLAAVPKPKVSPLPKKPAPHATPTSARSSAGPTPKPPASGSPTIGPSASPTPKASTPPTVSPTPKPTKIPLAEPDGQPVALSHADRHTDGLPHAVDG